MQIVCNSFCYDGTTHIQSIRACRELNLTVKWAADDVNDNKNNRQTDIDVATADRIDFIIRNHIAYR